MYRVQDYPEIQNSLFLTARGVGASRKLKGDVGIVSCFMKRSESEFSEKTTSQYYAALNKAIAWLEAEAAKCGANLKITGHHYYVNTPKNADPKQGYALVRDFMKLATVDEAQEYLENRMGFDEMPFILVYDEYARSFASKKMTVYNSHVDEASTIFRGRNGYDWSTIAHELLHQFGAFDYYYPEQVKERAERYFGNSIMGVGEDRMDDLTAYLVGWKNTISANTYWFLRDTMWLDKAAYNKAVEDAWKQKW